MVKLVVSVIALILLSVILYDTNFPRFYIIGNE